MLQESDRPLSDVHDLAMLDLDGVVYIGGVAIPHVSERIELARQAGLKIAFVTNNAARSPEQVAQHLNKLGISAVATDVVTSAQAASRVLLDRFGAGARIANLGGPGLEAALAEAGLIAVSIDDEADAIVSGYGPELRWKHIMKAAVRIRAGLPWVASNTDYTIPTADGIAPGHGVLVETLARFTGVTPTVAGKPEPPLLLETIRRVEGARPLMVGDRLDTDIEGAINVDVPSLLVLTGVTDLSELVAATAGQRPTYLSPDLSGLLEPHPAPAMDDGVTVLGGWRGRVEDGQLRITGEGATADWWRVAAVAGWTHLDAHGTAADVSVASVP